MRHTSLRNLRHFAAEHLTWLSLCGLVAVITGFTPEEWVAHFAEKLRVSGVVKGHWPTYLDIRAVLVAVGVGVIVTDVLLKRRAASRPAGTTAAHSPSTTPRNPPLLSPANEKGRVRQLERTSSLGAAEMPMKKNEQPDSGEKAFALDREGAALLRQASAFFKMGLNEAGYDAYRQAIRIYEEVLSLDPRVADTGRMLLGISCVELALRLSKEVDGSKKREAVELARKATPLLSEVLRSAGTKLAAEQARQLAAGMLMAQQIVDADSKARTR